MFVAKDTTPPIPRPTSRHHCNRPSLPQQRRFAKQAQKIDANHFFNLLTGPQLLEAVEAQLPEHRNGTIHRR